MLRSGYIRQWLTRPLTGLLAVCLLCFFYPKPLAQFYPAFDVQAHGGVCNLYPDHSTEAFLAALDLHVTTLYMGVAVTSDHRVVLSRYLTIDPKICSGSTQGMPIYQLTYAELKKVNCGKKNPSPQQDPFAMPLLTDLVIASEDHIKNLSRYAVDYCLEMNSSPATDDKEHPAPAEFSDIVYNAVQPYLPLERLVIASTDIRLLRYWNKTYPDIRLAFLAKNGKSLRQNCADLGFFPSAYCPFYDGVKNEDLALAQKNKVRIIPISINKQRQMLSMKGGKASGLITDRADLASHYNMTLSLPAK